MKIQLKKLNVNLRFSEETTMFNADVYVNDIKCAMADNHGHGGCTNYRAYPNQHELLKSAEEFCKGLPKVVCSDLDFEYDMNLEHYIDDLVEESIIAKQCAKDFNKGICYGKPTNYKIYGFKGITVAKCLETEKGITALAKAYQTVLGKLTEGETILNTNLPKSITQ